jgi:hypothetical protein
MHAPCRGRDQVRAFAARFRAAFPDLGFAETADLIAEGDYVVGQWKGGGTQTGEAFDDIPVGALPPGGGKKMEFTGGGLPSPKNRNALEPGPACTPGRTEGHDSPGMRQSCYRCSPMVVLASSPCSP